MTIRRRVLTLALLLAFSLNLFAGPLHAQSDAPGGLATYGVTCDAGQCKLTVNTSIIKTEVPVPATAPIRFDLPVGDTGFLSGAGLEISDKIAIRLPVGEIEIRAGEFLVGLNKQGQVDRLRGTATSVVPNLALPNGMKIGGEFAAEFGYEFGSEMGAISHLLEPDQRYLFLRLGEGFTLDTTLPGEAGQQVPLTLSVPQNESTTLVVDPASKVLYVDGRFNLSQVLRLAVVGGLMGIDVGQLPMLSGLALPLRSTVGVAALFSPDRERNFVELNGDIGIEGGPLGRLLQVEGAPLMLDSTVRVDRSGIRLQGVADARLAPATLLESGGTVELFIPFERLSDASIRIGGNLSVPVLGIATANEATLGGTKDGDPAVAGDAITEGELSWWDEASAWIGTAASGTAQGVAGAAGTSVSVLQGAVDSALSTAGSAATAAGSTNAAAAAGSAISGAAEGVACGVNQAQRLWCQRTGLCEVPEEVCPPGE
ncbi:MAG: hypothetical protein M9936_19070 [Caldilinea sp.]|nr:hypothetical protein [Caldilineaceae bacterium]MCB9120487.1 hypothetical protein [Caldilineaceae bacterium]MCO5211799.1 hypothetical protein [Caldilinea sp.]MCW5842436.1 hypothetical protein [Caldilinea sp.]HRW46507.1 hypothetical protein [Caldilinea sp.]